MKIRFDRAACAGWFQCVQEWDVFEMNMQVGKAELRGARELEEGKFELEVPEHLEEEAENAINSCPVNAIEQH